MGSFSKFLLKENIVNLNEALPLSVARRMTKLSGGVYKERYPEIFGDDSKKHRLYFEFKESEEKTQTQKEIEDLLKKNDFEEVFYKDNKAIKKKQQYKIGKVLNQIDPTLLDRYKKDREFKSDEKLLICISRHPYDVAGASTDRSWVSCMTLKLDLNKFKLTQNPSEGEILAHTTGGTYSNPPYNYVDCDVQLGVLVAYLIKQSDKNINSPLARVLIKPYMSDVTNDIVLEAMDKVYGRVGVGEATQKAFVSQVQTFIDEKWNKNYSGVFKHLESLYNDDAPQQIIKGIEKYDSAEAIESLLEELEIDDYRINKDLSVDVNGDVHLEEMGLTKIPIKFRIVKGDFSISGNKITSLEGCPIKVQGDFECNANPIESLKGCPENVRDTFEVTHCPNLKSIDGLNIKAKIIDLQNNKNLKTISDDTQCICQWLYIYNGTKISYDKKFLKQKFNVSRTIE